MRGVASSWWVPWWHSFLYLAFIMNRYLNVLTGKGQEAWCGMLIDLQFLPWVWFRLDYFGHREMNFDRWVGDSPGDCIYLSHILETQMVIFILSEESITLQYPSYSKFHWSPLPVIYCKPYSIWPQSSRHRWHSRPFWEHTPTWATQEGIFPSQHSWGIILDAG
jgi:hypothetical protein